MSENAKEEVVLFHLNPVGVSLEEVPVLVLTDTSVNIVEGLQADPLWLASQFKVSGDQAKVSDLVAKLSDKIVEVVSVRFFSQLTGIELIEFASFAGDSTMPFRTRYAVKHQGESAILYSSLSRKVASGWAVSEELKIISTKNLKPVKTLGRSLKIPGRK